MAARKTAKPKAKTRAKTRTIKAPGKKPITFKPGGLHASLGVPQGQKIPAGKVAAAAAGQYGPKAQKQAQFAKNVLTGPSKPAAPRRRRGASRG